MAYVAIKPCRFGGQSFRIGDVVPSELLHKGAVKNLLKMGRIAAENGEIASEPVNESPNNPITVVIRAEEGDMPLELTAEGLQAVFDVLTSTATQAEPVIGSMTDGDALILLHLSDSRKTIKEAAEARAKALNAEPAEEEEKEETETSEGKEGEQ